MINTSLHLSLRLAGSDILEHLKALYHLVMVTIDALQLFYLILRERKDVLMTPFFFYSELECYWWRTIDFLSKVGNAGIILNPKKFQFCQKSVDFAGFRISDELIEPLPKYLDSIRNFPTPKSAIDIRIGLV